MSLETYLEIANELKQFDMIDAENIYTQDDHNYL